MNKNSLNSIGYKKYTQEINLGHTLIGKYLQKKRELFKIAIELFFVKGYKNELLVLEY